MLYFTECTLEKRLVYMVRLFCLGGVYISLKYKDSLENDVRTSTSPDNTGL